MLEMLMSQSLISTFKSRLLACQIKLNYSYFPSFRPIMHFMCVSQIFLAPFSFLFLRPFPLYVFFLSFFVTLLTLCLPLHFIISIFFRLPSSHISLLGNGNRFVFFCSIFNSSLSFIIFCTSLPFLSFFHFF